MSARCRQCKILQRSLKLEIFSAAFLTSVNEARPPSGVQRASVLTGALLITDGRITQIIVIHRKIYIMQNYFTQADGVHIFRCFIYVKVHCKKYDTTRKLTTKIICVCVCFTSIFLRTNSNFRQQSEKVFWKMKKKWFCEKKYFDYSFFKLDILTSF